MCRFCKQPFEPGDIHCVDHHCACLLAVTIDRKATPRSNQSEDYERLTKAILFATMAHGTRTDKGGQPFIGHPLRVMAKLATPNIGPDVLIAAVLHDVCEDEDVDFAMIEKEFGPRVMEAVNSLTRRTANNSRRLFPHLTEEARRHVGETYFTYIRRCRKNPVARLVKFADLEDNMNPQRSGYDIHLTERYETALKILEETGLTDYQRGYIDGHDSPTRNKLEGTTP